MPSPQYPPRTIPLLPPSHLRYKPHTAPAKLYTWPTDPPDMNRPNPPAPPPPPRLKSRMSTSTNTPPQAQSRTVLNDMRNLYWGPRPGQDVLSILARSSPNGPPTLPGGRRSTAPSRWLHQAPADPVVRCIKIEESLQTLRPGHRGMSAPMEEVARMLLPSSAVGYMPLLTL